MKRFSFGRICSGIEAASVAWQPLGFEALWLSEIEPYPCRVLGAHYPAIPNLGDITAPDFVNRATILGAPDIIVGGTPCQAFSIAGLRRGLADERGNLTLRYVEICNEDMVSYLTASGWPEARARELAKTPDGHRYKALGNSMKVPVMRWIVTRIKRALEQIGWMGS